MRNRYLNPWYLYGEILDLFDSTRLDEIVAVTAIVSVAVHAVTGISFYQLFVLLSLAQLIWQGFDVPRVLRALKPYRRSKGGDA